jgi:alkylhydroperoxidase family enzyme
MIAVRCYNTFSTAKESLVSKTLSKTFRLGRLTVQALEQLVKAGRAPSQTALVEMLIAREKARLDLENEEQEMEAAWISAMNSGDYCAEMSAIEAEFTGADAEAAGTIR